MFLRKLNERDRKRKYIFWREREREGERVSESILSTECMIQIEQKERGRKSPVFSRKCQKEVLTKKLSTGRVFLLSDDNRP